MELSYKTTHDAIAQSGLFDEMRKMVYFLQELAENEDGEWGPHFSLAAHAADETKDLRLHIKEKARELDALLSQMIDIWYYAEKTESGDCNGDDLIIRLRRRYEKED